jgi:hypothetical protein
MPELWKLVEDAVGQPLGRGARRLLLGLGAFAGTFLALAGLGIKNAGSMAPVHPAKDLRDEPSGPS